MPNTCTHVQLHIDVETRKRSQQPCDENFRRILCRITEIWSGIPHITHRKQDLHQIFCNRSTNFSIISSRDTASLHNYTPASYTFNLLNALLYHGRSCYRPNPSFVFQASYFQEFFRPIICLVCSISSIHTSSSKDLILHYSKNIRPV